MNLNFDNWNVNCSFEKMTPTVMQEAGTNHQSSFQLVNKNNPNNIIECRAKKIDDNFRETLAYVNLAETNSSLNTILPKYIGVYDEDNSRFLQKKEIESIKGQDFKGRYHLILKDCTKNFKAGTTLATGAKIQDFKFSTDKMNMSSDNELFINRLFKTITFSLSNFPFAYQKHCKKTNIFNLIKNIWNRLFAIINTRSEMTKQFQRLSDENLDKAIQKMKKIKSVLKENDFIAFDSSLLFVPKIKQVNGEDQNDLSIHLIDLGDLTSKEEMDLKTYKKTKREMLKAVKKAKDCAKAIQKKRSAAPTPLQLAESYQLEALPISHKGSTYYFRDVLQNELKVWRKSKSAKTTRFEKYISDKFEKDPSFFERCKASQVRYFSDADRVKTQVQIKYGVLKQVGLDGDKEIQSMSAGTYCFVIKDDVLYCHPKGSTESGVVQHSSFFAGQSVDSAGLLVLDEKGRVKKIINHSGHYLPGADALYTASKFFKERLSLEDFQDMTIKFVNKVGFFKDFVRWIQKHFKLELFPENYEIQNWIRKYEVQRI